MKRLHQGNLFCWSEFNEDRNIDFHSYVWVQEKGNVVIDPLPMSSHDEKHLESLGKVSHILITNSDHIRNAEGLAEKTGAVIWGPQGEQDSFPFICDRWLKEEEVLPHLQVYEMQGSKTTGELAFLLEGKTLVTGDLVRAHEGGKLCLLPDGKLKDKAAAITSIRQFSKISQLEAILLGDGWPIFRDGKKFMTELLDSFS